MDSDERTEHVDKHKVITLEDKIMHLELEDRMTRDVGNMYHHLYPKWTYVTMLLIIDESELVEADISCSQKA